jgi:hypothetical protein
VETASFIFTSKNAFRISSVQVLLAMGKHVSRTFPVPGDDEIENANRFIMIQEILIRKGETNLKWFSFSIKRARN